MLPCDNDVSAFRGLISDRGTNDKENKKRERLVVWLLNSGPSERQRCRSSLDDQDLFDRVVTELDIAIEKLRRQYPDLSDSELLGSTVRGGRHWNYDFGLSFETAGGLVEVPIELKRGRSIYEQPQFLSLYVSSPFVLRESVLTYAEFFFDEYFEYLSTATHCAPISRAEYLAVVCNTKYEEPTFSHLYAFAKLGGSELQLLRELQYESIDSYLRYLLGLTDAGIDFDSLQQKLFEQLPKHFLSWDSSRQVFLWERFTSLGLELSGKIDTKAKSSGQLTTIVLPTRTGQQLELLLRWKNNPCVKGPAWQIRLTPE